MAFSFFDFLRPKNGMTHSMEITCRELFEAVQEFRIRELCFMICVDMIANALGIGVWGVWLAQQVDWLYRGAVFIWRFSSGKWQTKALIKEA